MKRTLLKATIAALMLSSLAACIVVPARPGYGYGYHHGYGYGHRYYR